MPQLLSRLACIILIVVVVEFDQVCFCLLQLEGEQYPTMNMVLPLWMLMVEKAEEKVNLDKPESTLCGRLMDEMDKRMPMISSKPAVVACQLDPRFRQLNFFEESDSKKSHGWLQDEYAAELKRTKHNSMSAPALNLSTATALPSNKSGKSSFASNKSGKSSPALAKTTSKQRTLTQSLNLGSGSGSWSNGKEEKKSAQETKSKKASTPKKQQKSEVSAASTQIATASSSGTKRKATDDLPVTAKQKADKRAKLLEQAAKQFGDRADRIADSNEVKDYMSMPSVPLDTDPLQWWREHQQRFPVLARVARRFLCIPASSAPAERVWSTAGNTITEKRARLSDETVENLILCHENFPVCMLVAQDLDPAFGIEGIFATKSGSGRLFETVVTTSSTPGQTQTQTPTPIPTCTTSGMDVSSVPMIVDS
jgi:hypothetical protein